MTQTIINTNAMVQSLNALNTATNNGATFTTTDVVIGLAIGLGTVAVGLLMGWLITRR